MRASIVNVGDELLAGDVENTNATWLASQLTGRGVEVAEIAVIPDDVDRIADTVAGHRDAFDAVLVTGGLGSTPDDETVDGIAAALDRPVERHDRTYDLIERTVTGIREEYPDFEFDLDRAARRPAGSDPIENEEGIAPGFVCENVYVIPGIPSEMKATFRQVAGTFEGDVAAETLYSTETESHLVGVLETVREEFDVAVGCYPGEDKRIKRIKLRSAERERLDAAVEWLADRPQITRDEPE